jgi:hypothetical protein
MNTVVKEVLGFEVEYQNVPETLVEAVQMCGGEQRVLDALIDQVIFHKQNGIARNRIVAKLAEVTGVKPLTEKDGEKEVVVETAQKYVNRLRAELGDEIVDSNAPALRHLATQIDWSATERGSGTARVAAKWLAAVDQLVEAGKFELFCTKYGIDAANLPEEVLRPTVALKIKSIVEEQAAQALKNAMADV